MTSCRSGRRAASTKLQAEHGLQDEEVRKHHDAQNDAVDAEALEVVTADLTGTESLYQELQERLDRLCFRV